MLTNMLKSSIIVYSIMTTSQSASVASNSVPDQRSIPQVPNVIINDQNDAEMDSNTN